MKFITKHLLLTFTLMLSLNTSHAANFWDVLEPAKIKKEVINQFNAVEVNFGENLGNIDLVQGINIGAKYNYDVQSSYIDHFYTRIDKWDVNLGINVGDALKDLVDIPFSFSVNGDRSFFFVRQFNSKLDAIEALPYGPHKLPLTANLALKNLIPGDFVSMPANMNIAFSAAAGTDLVSPSPLNLNTSIYYVISGEFTIQVFKLDNSHVRVKLISRQGSSVGSASGMRATFQLLGINLVDKVISKLIDRDLVQMGLSYNPGAQFILDYVFDLNNEDAKDAYNQIIASSLKFKDVVLLNQILDARDLKDKLISSYEKADKIFAEDHTKNPKDRRVQRIFKGFDNYQGHNRHLKLSFFIAHYLKDRALNENKITFLDKNEKNLEFYYPTFSKYLETSVGKSFFELKDQTFQNNFGLIPRFEQEDTRFKNPEIGFTLERKDRTFTSFNQKSLANFMQNELPPVVMKKVAASGWMDKKNKFDTRINMQMILKAQGFEYLKGISEQALKAKLFEYVKVRLGNQDTTLADFLLVPKMIQIEQLNFLASSLSDILKNETHNSEDVLRRLIKLNEYTLFDKIGVGFLVSLMPEDKLEQLVYVKIDFLGQKLDPLEIEYGTLNYKTIYKELDQIQSRLSNRSYDLRLSNDDQEIENKSINN